jgi:hypothetical protein
MIMRRLSSLSSSLLYHNHNTNGGKTRLTTCHGPTAAVPGVRAGAGAGGVSSLLLRNMMLVLSVVMMCSSMDCAESHSQTVTASASVKAGTGVNIEQDSNANRCISAIIDGVCRGRGGGASAAAADSDTAEVEVKVEAAATATADGSTTTTSESETSTVEVEVEVTKENDDDSAVLSVGSTEDETATTIESSEEDLLLVDSMESENNKDSENSSIATSVLEEEDVKAETTSPEEQSQATSTPASKSKYIFSVYQDGDGHLDDLDGLPTRYLVMAKHQRAVALKAFEATVQYRKEHDVDRVLATPNPKYDQVKLVFPHYFAGRDVLGNPVLVQRPGLLNKPAMSSLKVTNEDLMHHMIYTLEYCWNVIEPTGRGYGLTVEVAADPTTSQPSSSPPPTYGVMTSIVDLKGLGLGTLRDQNTMAFVKQVVSMMSHHYPSRSHKTLLINTPRWFGTLYTLLKPMLRDSTKQKIDILSLGKAQDDALYKYLGPDGVPEELLSTYDDKTAKTATSSSSELHISTSTKNTPGPNSQLERDMRQLCMTVLEEHDNTPMLPIVL